MNRVYFAVLTALFVGMLIYGFSPAEESTPKPAAMPAETDQPANKGAGTTGQVYTRETLIDQITDGCVSGMVAHGMAEQVSRDYCTCYATAVTDNLAIEDFSRIGLSGPTQQDRDVMETAGQGCAQKIIESNK